MQALDLSKTPPRKARAELAGVTFLPRSIDKFRATLPGGVEAGYTIEGFTATMLEKLGISADDMREAIAKAESDDEVASYVQRHAVPGGIDAWQTFVLNREIYNGDRADAIAENPWLADHPELVYSLDFLQYREDNGLDDD